MVTDVFEQKRLRGTVSAGAIAIFVTATFLFIIIMVISAVPIQVDEAIQYHPIACEFYENAKYHTFWNPCDGSRNLDLFGIQFKRAYDYIGGFSSYLYYPFFRLSPGILTQRIIGILFLFVFVGMLMLLEDRNRLSVLILFGLSFPLIYQLVNDTGPVRYSMCMLPIAPWLVRCVIRTRQLYKKAVLNVILGFLLFLGLEDKPFFLYLVPSVLILIIAYNYDDKQGAMGSIKFVISQILVALTVFGALTYLYLVVAKTPSGGNYLSELTGAVRPYELTEVAKNILSFMTNFEKFSSMVYSSRKFRPLNIGLSLSVWMLGLVLVAKVYKMRINSLPAKTVLTMLAFVVSILILLLTRNAVNGHHFIFPYAIALLVVCQCALSGIQGRFAFFLLYVFFSVILSSQLPFLTPNTWSSWERYKVFDFLKQEEIAKDYIIAHLSFGTYYVASLYGEKEQLSLQIRTLDNQTVTKIIGLSDTLKRKILCVCNGPDCNSKTLSDRFLSRIKFKEVNLPTKDWKVYLEMGRV